MKLKQTTIQFSAPAGPAVPAPPAPARPPAPGPNLGQQTTARGRRRRAAASKADADDRRARQHKPRGRDGHPAAPSRRLQGQVRGRVSGSNDQPGGLRPGAEGAKQTSQLLPSVAKLQSSRANHISFSGQRLHPDCAGDCAEDPGPKGRGEKGQADAAERASPCCVGAQDVGPRFQFQFSKLNH
jgi:hypothetical protein